MNAKIKLPYIANKLIILFTLGVLLNSCASKQNIVYFQDEPISSFTDSENTNFELHYKPNDILTINVSVSGADQSATAPYNLPLISTFVNNENVNGNLAMQNYMINKEGNIEFPGLGIVKLEGLTNMEATAILKEKLSPFLVDPIVTIRLINFTISVIGEVNNPGTFTVQGEKISLPQALGLASDLSIYGKRDNILLIREVDGEKKYHKFDLTSINTLYSPNYYLTQNDIIVVEPNNARVRSSSYNQNNGIIISAVGTLATIVAILIK